MLRCGPSAALGSSEDRLRHGRPRAQPDHPYSWWGRLLFDHQDAYRLVVSPPVVAEYLEVIRRLALVRKYRSVATRDPHAVLDLIATATVVEPADVPRVSRDPAGGVFLAAARAGGAAYLVTEDADLLDLGAYAGTAIVTAAAFLRVLGSVIDRRSPQTNW